MKLYSVITIESAPSPEERQRLAGKRTVAICTKIENAKEIVEKNVGDIFETSYTYAVIVEVESDLLYGGLALPYPELWYQWEGDVETGRYVAIEKPVEYERIVISF